MFRRSSLFLCLCFVLPASLSAVALIQKRFRTRSSLICRQRSPNARCPLSVRNVELSNVQQVASVPEKVILGKRRNYEDSFSAEEDVAPRPIDRPLLAIIERGRRTLHYARIPRTPPTRTCQAAGQIRTSGSFDLTALRPVSTKRQIINPRIQRRSWQTSSWCRSVPPSPKEDGGRASRRREVQGEGWAWVICQSASAILGAVIC